LAGVPDDEQAKIADDKFMLDCEPLASDTAAKDCPADARGGSGRLPAGAAARSRHAATRQARPALDDAS